ncbi:MAG: hypothetical protein Q4F53_08190 [Nesterenkonia sp.]|nr:hypothetical protein [Nesterenkonia sp.]
MREISYAYLPVPRLPEQVPMSTRLSRRRDVHRLVDTVANFHQDEIRTLDQEYREDGSHGTGDPSIPLGEWAAEMCPLLGMLCRSDIGTDTWTRELLEAIDGADCVDWDAWAERHDMRFETLAASEQVGEVVELRMGDGARETWTLVPEVDLTDRTLRRHLIWGMLSDEKPHSAIVLTEH